GPVLRARLRSDRHFDGERVTGFAGIGRPEKFFGMLRALGAELVETHSFADHHPYSAVEIARLRNRAERTRTMLITTEKDFVRLKPHDRVGIEVLPVRAVFDDPSALGRLLAEATAQQ
ncbi:MAG: tetraacyldisaccharide 4'-kinase, partial [Rhizomicrobium sp.]